MKFTRNMHRLDQVFRLILGSALIYYGFIDNSLVSDPLYGVLLGVFGIINIVSGIWGFCPVYLLAGIRTYKCIEPQP